ncbi:MAG: M23 family metallopeptidase [Angelakisella sp.]
MIHTLHRRLPPRHGSSPGGSLSEAGAMLTVVQVSFCVLLLLAVFTLQFLDGERYDKTGELYRAVMGSWEDGSKGEAQFVGAFGTPITPELLQRYADALMSGKNQPPARTAAGQGGGGNLLPQNIIPGHVVLLANPHYPVYGRVTSSFGWRTHPITGKEDFHNGLDIAAPLGAAIYAALPGTVIDVGKSVIYGNFIKLRHGANVETVYNHCSEILAQTGAVVRQGERIALVGSTGLSTGAHLHFDLLVNERYCDPMNLLAPGNRAGG